MNAIELVQKDNVEKVLAWYCSECRIVKRTQVEAEDCCTPYRCRDCGVEAPRYHFACEGCRKKKDQAREQAEFDKAKKVTQAEYAGEWVYDDRRSNYHSSVEEALDYYDDDPDPPEWFYGTEAEEFGIDADRVLEDALQDSYDGAYDCIPPSAIKELQDFLDKWSKDYGPTSYSVDYSTVVLVDDPTSSAELPHPTASSSNPS